MSFLVPIAFPVVFTHGKNFFLFLPQFVGRRVRIAPVVPFALRPRVPLAAFMQQAIAIFCLCVKLAALEKLGV